MSDMAEGRDHDLGGVLSGRARWAQRRYNPHSTIRNFFPSSFILLASLFIGKSRLAKAMLLEFGV